MTPPKLTETELRAMRERAELGLPGRPLNLGADTLALLDEVARLEADNARLTESLVASWKEADWSLAGVDPHDWRKGLEVIRSCIDACLSPAAPPAGEKCDL